VPIYEYQCPDCGHEFEALQKMSDDPISLCPGCGADNVKKQISQTAFVLKGGGWYKDHYGLKSGAGGSETAASSRSTDKSSKDNKSKTKAAESKSSTTTGTKST